MSFTTYASEVIGLGALGGVLSLAGCVCFVGTGFSWLRDCYIESNNVETVARIQDKFVSQTGPDGETIERREVAIQYIAVDRQGTQYFGQKIFKFVTAQVWDDLEVDTVTLITYSPENVQRDPSWDQARSQTINRVLRIIIGAGLLVANHGIVDTRGGWTIYYILFDLLFTFIYFMFFYTIWKCVILRCFRNPAALRPNVRCIPLRDVDRLDMDEFVNVMKKNGWIKLDNGTFEQGDMSMLEDVNSSGQQIAKHVSVDIGDVKREV